MPISATCDICGKTFDERDYCGRIFDTAPAGEVYCVDCQIKVDQKYRDQVAAIDRAAIIIEEKEKVR